MHSMCSSPILYYLARYWVSVMLSAIKPQKAGSSTSMKNEMPCWSKLAKISWRKIWQKIKTTHP